MWQYQNLFLIAKLACSLYFETKKRRWKIIEAWKCSIATHTKLLWSAKLKNPYLRNLCKIYLDLDQILNWIKQITITRSLCFSYCCCNSVIIICLYCPWISTWIRYVDPSRSFVSLMSFNFGKLAKALKVSSEGRNKNWYKVERVKGSPFHPEVKSLFYQWLILKEI